MIEIQFDNPNYVGLLEQLAISLKSSIKNNILTIPEVHGEGWLWALELQSGISVMVTDTKLNQDFIFNGSQCNQQFFSLQFNEIYTFSKRAGVTNEVLVQSFVMLFDTLKPSQFSIPAATRLKSLRFYFSLEQLSTLLTEEVIEKLFNKELLEHLTSEQPKIIDVHYRPILEELMIKEIKHPLKFNFIQNRILLLLEKYISKQQKVNLISAKNRLNVSELERLMQVENLLLKDYSIAPPTIEQLSKICAMSATKLKQEFRALYGSPIYEYYQKNRMSKAKALLLEGGYTSKEVGSLIGYSNLSHFAAAFKKEFGISPSDLLAKHLNQSN